MAQGNRPSLTLREGERWGWVTIFFVASKMYHLWVGASGTILASIRWRFSL